MQNRISEVQIGFASSSSSNRISTLCVNTLGYSSSGGSGSMSIFLTGMKVSRGQIIIVSRRRRRRRTNPTTVDDESNICSQVAFNGRRPRARTTIGNTVDTHNVLYGYSRSNKGLGWRQEVWQDFLAWQANGFAADRLTVVCYLSARPVTTTGRATTF